MLPSVLPYIPSIRYGFFGTLLLMVAYFVIGGALEPQITDPATRATIGYYGLRGLIAGVFLILALGGALFVYAYFYTILPHVRTVQHWRVFLQREKIVSVAVYGWWALWLFILLYTLTQGTFDRLFSPGGQ